MGAEVTPLGWRLHVDDDNIRIVDEDDVAELDPANVLGRPLAAYMGRLIITAVQMQKEQIAALSACAQSLFGYTGQDPSAGSHKLEARAALERAWKVLETIKETGEKR